MNARDYLAGQIFAVMLLLTGVAFLTYNLLSGIGSPLWSWYVTSALVDGCPLLFLGVLLRTYFRHLYIDDLQNSRPPVNPLFSGFGKLLLLAGFLLLAWTGLAHSADIIGPPWFEEKRQLMHLEAMQAYIEGEIHPGRAGIVNGFYHSPSVRGWLHDRYPLGIISAELWVAPLVMILGIGFWMFSSVTLQAAHNRPMMYRRRPY